MIALRKSPGLWNQQALKQFPPLRKGVALNERLSEAMKLKNDLVNERESLSETGSKEWVSENGEALACGLRSSREGP